MKHWKNNPRFQNSLDAFLWLCVLTNLMIGVSLISASIPFALLGFGIAAYCAYVALLPWNNRT